MFKRLVGRRGPVRGLCGMGKSREKQLLRESLQNDAAVYKKDQAFRVALESSWLNWTRNAIIGSISSIGLCTLAFSVDKENPYTLPSKLMAGVGILFMTSGTAQYVLSMLVFESNSSILSWYIFNASALWGLYVGSLYHFFQHFENRFIVGEQQIEIDDEEQEILNEQIDDGKKTWDSSDKQEKKTWSSIFRSN